MGKLSKALLVLNTVRYLKPSQLYNQVMTRVKPKKKFQDYSGNVNSYREYNLWIYDLDSDPDYIQRFMPNELIKNRLTLLNETRTINGWKYDDVSHLWNFNVHYMEYLVALVAYGKETGNHIYTDKANEILEDWYRRGSTEPNSNQAYTISLRVINQLLIADVVEDKKKLYESIYAQYRYLILNQEKHLLGNHYLENLKAIVICSLVFGEDGVYEKYIKRLISELEEQITPDGLHFELSLMYHKIVLEDLLRIALVLKQAKRKELEQIISYLQKMCNALYSLEHGLIRTPLFNDVGEGVSKCGISLLKACEGIFGIVPKKETYISGYYRLDEGKITVIEDCGELGPVYMPGHAHCDCLSFELFYDGRPIFVNCGTYQYQGQCRKYFRSAMAHNTVQINDHEQSELWGEHRAARRISRVKSKRIKNGILAEYVNFLNEKHRRALFLKENEFRVVDSVRGNQAKSYLHLAPGLVYKDGLILGFETQIRVIPDNSSIEVEDGMYASGFGKLEHICCLVFSWNNDNLKHGYRVLVGGVKND